MALVFFDRMNLDRIGRNETRWASQRQFGFVATVVRNIASGMVNVITVDNLAPWKRG